MPRFWERAKPRCGYWLSCESNCRIFRINPTKQRTAFFGVGRYKRDTSWRWQKRYRSRINNLEYIKAQCVGQQRQDQESCEHRPLPPSAIPAEEKRFGRNVRGNAVHFGGVAASATDVMPCSSAAFVTSATVS
jgi:hypothetical protein